MGFPIITFTFGWVLANKYHAVKPTAEHQKFERSCIGYTASITPRKEYLTQECGSTCPLQALQLGANCATLWPAEKICSGFGGSQT